jgi:drug/metabolite transporter (DMT)-like permease
VSPLFIGILLNFIGTFIYTVGTTFTNYYVRNGLIVSASGLEMLSLNFASPATVSPLCSLIIVWTIVFDWKNITKILLLKSIGMVIGIVLSLINVDTSDKEIVTLLNAHGVVMITCGVMVICIRYFYYQKRHIEESILLPGIIGGFTNVSLKLLINYGKIKEIRGFLFMAFFCLLFGYHQLKSLNVLLDSKGKSIINPMYISTLITSIVVWNSVTFNEKIDNTFILGCVIIIASVMYEEKRVVSI